MRKIVFSALLAVSLSAGAQTASELVVMTVNGKPVTRAEFEYFYNKNCNIEGAVEQKSVAEYADMFVNYKLKVAAAEEARMDTAASFRQEFETYRDMQLMPYLVDSSFIDSVAVSLYDRTKERLQGKDLLRPAHILVLLRQKASEADKERAKQRIDSIYGLLKGGLDFAEAAKKFSQDPGTARTGGLLPWVGPGALLKEFEDVAYTLQPGQMSEPFLSPVGYHIVLMKERKQLEPYDTLRPQILASLHRQGIEEASAEARIKKLTDASGGRLTREAVIDSVLNARSAANPDLKFLVNEYYEGLLMYAVSKQHVWDVAEKDEAALEAYYKKNKKKYRWTEPRFKGFVFHYKNPKEKKAIKKFLAKQTGDNWRAEVKKRFNKDSVQVLVNGPYLCKKGENPYVDQYIFKTGKGRVLPSFPYSDVAGKKLSQPKSYRDVKSLVVADYQEELEKAWVAGLRAKYPFEINQEVLKTVNNH